VLETAKNRRYARIGLPRGMVVSWEGKGVHVVSRVGTIGLGGLFIDVPDPPPLGEIIQLLFEVPDGEVRARAIVRSLHPGKGMGVEFTFMASEGRARLHRLLSKLLGSLDSQAGLAAR
jgi:PilZ domain